MLRRGGGAEGGKHGDMAQPGEFCGIGHGLFGGGQIRGRVGRFPVGVGHEHQPVGQTPAETGACLHGAQGGDALHIVRQLLGHERTHGHVVKIYHAMPPEGSMGASLRRAARMRSRSGVQP